MVKRIALFLMIMVVLGVACSKKESLEKYSEEEWAKSGWTTSYSACLGIRPMGKPPAPEIGGKFQAEIIDLEFLAVSGTPGGAIGDYVIMTNRGNGNWEIDHLRYSQLRRTVNIRKHCSKY